VIAVLVCASLFANLFTPVVLAAGGIALLILTAGSPMRVFTLSIGLMSVFTAGELAVVRLGLGFAVLQIDEMFLLAFFFYYAMAVADGKAERTGAGLLPFSIAAFLLLALISAARGFAQGAGRDDIWSLRTLFGYAAFFPCCWLASEPRARERLWTVLFVSATLAGVSVVFRAMTGLGQGVFLTETSGLRVVTRAANITAVMMVALVARIWKAPRKPPIVLAVPAIVVMAASVLLSQTRALWAGTLLALAAAWFLSLFRRERGRPLARRLVVSLSLLAGLIAAGVLAVSMLGLLSTTDLTQRAVGVDETAYPIDVSLLSRLLSWAAVLKEVYGPALLFGKGLGASITYFKPEFAEMRTLSYVDGSFWQTLLDMGLTGVLALAALYAAALVSSARLFLRTADQRRASVALGVFCGSVVLAVAAQMSSVITNYSYTVIWALILAILHLEWRAERRCAEPPCPVGRT